jgi:hypothetical protein
MQQNFDGMEAHNSMLLDILEKCSLILISDVTLNSLTQCKSQEFSCYVDGFTNPINVHSKAFKKKPWVFTFIISK